MSQSGTDSITRSQLFRYSLIALPVAFAGLPLYIHAPDFYVREQGLSLAAIGGLLLILRASDAILDPVIGFVSDRLGGRRRLLFFSSVALLAIGFTALFNPLSGSGFAWFALWTFVATLAYSLLTINLNALGALWSRAATDQVRITTCREGFALAGVLLAAITPTLLHHWFDMSLSFSIFSLIFLLVVSYAAIEFAWWWTPATQEKFLVVDDRPAPNAVPNERLLTMVGKQMQALKLLLTQGPVRLFFFVYLFSSLASAIPAVLVLFFIEERLGSGDLAGLFLMLFFLSGALSMPLWQKLAARIGRVSAWQTAMLIAIVTFIWAALLGDGDLWAYAAVCIGSGIALGGELSIPPAMLASMIHRRKQRSQASSWFAWMAFLAKLNLALAAGITFPLLELSGFVPGQENSESALLALSAAYALIPCALKLLALLMVQLARSSQSRHELQSMFEGDSDAEEQTTIQNSAAHRSTAAGRLLEPRSAQSIHGG